MTTEQGNILLKQTDDDGEVEIVNGIFTADGGLGTMAYLAMFGGNEDDDGRQENPARWWGNLGETNPDRQYVGRTEDLLRRLPAVPANLSRIKDAALKDLETFTAAGIATSVAVTVSIPALNSVRIAVSIEADGEQNDFAFVENWRANA